MIKQCHSVKPEGSTVLDLARGIKVSIRVVLASMKFIIYLEVRSCDTHDRVFDVVSGATFHTNAII